MTEEEHSIHRMLGSIENLAQLTYKELKEHTEQEIPFWGRVMTLESKVDAIALDMQRLRADGTKQHVVIERRLDNLEKRAVAASVRRTLLVGFGTTAIAFLAWISGQLNALYPAQVTAWIESHWHTKDSP